MRQVYFYSTFQYQDNECALHTLSHKRHFMYRSLWILYYTYNDFLYIAKVLPLLDRNSKVAKPKRIRINMANLFW